MQLGIDEIVASAHHVRLNMDRLEQVAAKMPISIESNWVETYRTAEEHYQHTLPPLPNMDLSDLDLLQWVVVGSSQGFLFWERTPDGGVVPYTVSIGGVKYVGGIGVEISHARAIRAGRNILDPQVLVSMTMEDIENH